MEPTLAARPSTASIYPWSPPAGGTALTTTTIVVATFTLMLFVGMLAAARAGTSAPVAPAMLIAIGAGVVLVGAIVYAGTQRFVEISPWVRGTVVLASVQAAIAVAALVLWLASSKRFDDLSYRYPIHAWLPAPAIAFTLGLVVVAAAGLRAPRRATTPRWLQAAAAGALTFLVAAALWLPIYAEYADYGDGFGYLVRDDATLVHALVSVLLAPILAAILAATIVWRRPRWRGLAARVGAGVAGWMLIVAVMARSELHEHEQTLYGNFVPALFGAAWFAMATIVAIAVTHVRTLRVAARDRRRPAPWRQDGIVMIKAPSTTAVGRLVNAGWLAGLEATTCAFTLRTRGGDLPIPAGAAVIAPLPSWTAQAQAGAAVPVVSEGDHVVISGFVGATGVEPYRTGVRPMPGTSGLVITTDRRADEPVARDLLLRVWRPCAALLVAVTIAGLPGLIGALE